MPERAQASLHVTDYPTANESLDLLDQGFLWHNAITIMSGNSGLAASVKIDFEQELAFPGITEYEILELHKAGPAQTFR